MIAATVGILTIVLAVWLWRRAEEPLLKKAGWIALALVCAQGILGGITVLFKLPVVASVGHACLGNSFFPGCAASPSWRGRTGPRGGSDGLQAAPIVTLDDRFILFQLLFGAIYRHTGMMLHMHFLGAVLVFVHVLLLFRRVRQAVPFDDWFALPAAFLVGLLFLQIGLGIYTCSGPTSECHGTRRRSALILAVTSVISSKVSGEYTHEAAYRRLHRTDQARLTSLVIFTTWLGYAFAARPLHYGAISSIPLRSWLVASGAAALNEYMERDLDALMKRTQTRPLPEGRLAPRPAFYLDLPSAPPELLNWRASSIP